VNGALPLRYSYANHASDYACIVFIFFFTFGYSLGFGPAAWVYGAEVSPTSDQDMTDLQIFPTNFRAIGLNFAASGGSIGSIIVAQVWPVGIQNIGSRTYFIFMAINLVCVPILYAFYPETRYKKLEDMEALFDKNHAAVSGTPSEEVLPEPAPKTLD
jgi:hypothetical protein